MIHTNTLLRKVHKAWLMIFISYPKTTGIMTILIYILVIVSIVTSEQRDRAKREKLRAESLSYINQVQKINSIEQNLQQLIDFIREQKVQLHATEDTINNLKAEHSRLSPMVSTDRATVEAILRTNADRLNSNIWRERIYGFVAGIASSISAAILIHISKIVYNKTVTHN